ncbi:hypothetical protein [Streptomyces avermitilis]|uniref:hypothetical protein n=1 Tax=Streptomyces avermitilis TaxID=33903 RepID=UPI0036CFE939
MYTRGRTLKFAAVLTMVVLALTGFSRGRGHGGSHGGHSSGGGCSSSSQNHDSSSSSTSGGGSYSSGSTTSGAGSDDSYDDSDDDSYSSGSGSSGSSGGSTYNRRPTHRSHPTSSSGGDEPLKDGTARVVSCATKKAPYATVEVKNPNARKGTFWITVSFMGKDGLEIVDHYVDVRVPAKGKATVDVEVGGAGLVDDVDHCEVDPVAESSS